MSVSPIIACCFWPLLTLAPALPFAASAGESSPADAAAMRAELESLRELQAARVLEMRAAESRLSALEAKLAALKDVTEVAGSSPGEGAAEASTTRQAGNPGLQLSGDFRVRFEANSAAGQAPRRDRGVARARLRAAYDVSDRFRVGAMVSTGDPQNPRTGDVTLTGYDADLPVKLAQAYVTAALGPLKLTAGKMPQPLLRTELVWDGDVNPQGVAATTDFSVGTAGALQLTGLYFLVDESAAGRDSDMVGLQLAYRHDLTADLQLELAAAYYDYSLHTTPGVSPAAFRGNLIAPGGGYLSDFNLADGIVAVTYGGFGARWPLRLVGDYVRNDGAVAGDDTGFELDIMFGRSSRPGDWRVSYGYSQAGVDAVLGAFSTDNTDIATNYLQHALALDYVLSPSITLNATAYHYRPKDPRYAGSRDANRWLDRIRLNLQLTF